jgi:hypothetical protein
MTLPHKQKTKKVIHDTITRCHLYNKLNPQN